MLLNVILTIHVMLAIAIVVLVLLQHGKGADMGAAFGGGSAGSLFGASGSANFLSRTTAILAAVFFASTLALAYLGNARPVSSGSVLDGAAVVAPAPAGVASGPAGQIPGSGAATVAPAPVAPAAPVAPGPAQIPSK